MFARILVAAASLALVSCSSSTASEVSNSAAPIPTDQQAFLDACEPWDDWDKPAPPFKVFGDTYYVGTCGIASVLIATDRGHLVIDSGTEAGAEIVLKNIRALGFEPQDVEVLLHSHEHFDHVGGMAKLEKETGGTVYASPEAGFSLLTGKGDKRDPQFGIHEAMAGVKSVQFLKGDGQVWDERFEEYLLNFEGRRLNAIRTPGHTPGALSWQWQSCEGTDCKTIVYADSLSPVSSDEYRFSDHPEYVAQFRAGLNRLAAIPCDILLAPHPSHAQLFKHLEGGSLLAMAAPCPDYAAKKHADLDKRLAKEAATQPSAGE